MNKTILIPAALLVYLLVMDVVAWPFYIEGSTSALLFWGGNLVCLLCIAGLHFHLKRGKRHAK